MMYEILTKCIVFIKLSANNFLQVCGAPIASISESNMKTKKEKSFESMIFYGSFASKSFGLYKEHLLNNLNVSKNSSNVLLRCIFSDRNSKDLSRSLSKNISSLKLNLPFKKKIQRLPKYLLPLVDIFKNIIKRHKKINYSIYLNKHCPYPRFLQPQQESVNEIQENNKQILLQDLINENLSNFKVWCFITRICDKLFPRKLFFGIKYNFSLFRRAIKQFLELRKFEKFPILKFIQSFKTEKMAFLFLSYPNKTKNDFLNRKSMNKKFFVWVFEEIICPLIKNNFYVTEKVQHKNKMFFYRKKVWEKLNQLSVETYQNEPTKIFEKIDEKNSLEISKNKTKYSQLRFLPKDKGVRPIMNLKQQNYQMKETLSVLYFEKDRQPHLLGFYYLFLIFLFFIFYFYFIFF